MRTYCGACAGERGCGDCKKTVNAVEYTGYTEFFAKENVQEMSVFCEGAEKERQYGIAKELFLAADLGTTTLAFVCGDETGEVLASYGTENPQRNVAADVIGRVDAALRGQYDRLTNEIKEALVKGFLFVLKKGIDEIERKGIYPDKLTVGMSVAGNTVMEHLLLGYPVKGLAKAPFTPYATELVKLPFSTLFSGCTGYDELPDLLKEGAVTIFPCLSAFVGGDAVAGAYALFGQTEKVGEKKQNCALLLDLGTNGELLLSVKGKLYGTAAAMGSAFEGGAFAYASDLFRLVAEARKQGVLDETGLLAEPYFTEGFHGLYQEEIREFQLAKGALRAGIDLLCRRSGISPSEVEQVYVAGGLGRYCNTEDLFDAELLPRAFYGKTEVVGNSCLGGQLRYLKKGESMVYWETELFNLAEEPEFEEQFYRCMNFERTGETEG
ncbi:MAG: DUF4445 domain-containing protein [Lachnospiraceae bacterium]|nr:DUF4445 domain-containing protein [Lachnospiraceae bacterium]